jgi:hypothetical protein
MTGMTGMTGMKRGTPTWAGVSRLLDPDGGGIESGGYRGHLYLTLVCPINPDGERVYPRKFAGAAAGRSVELVSLRAAGEAISRQCPPNREIATPLRVSR